MITDISGGKTFARDAPSGRAFSRAGGVRRGWSRQKDCCEGMWTWAGGSGDAYQLLYPLPVGLLEFGWPVQFSDGGGGIVNVMVVARASDKRRGRPDENT